MCSPLYLLLVFFSYLPQSLLSMQLQSHMLPIEQVVTQQDLFATQLVNILLFYPRVRGIQASHTLIFNDYVQQIAHKVAASGQTAQEIRQAIYATNMVMQVQCDKYFKKENRATMTALVMDMTRVLELNIAQVVHAATIFKTAEYHCIKQLKDLLNQDTRYQQLGDYLEKRGRLKRFMQHLQKTIADYNTWHAKEVGLYRFLPYTHVLQEKIRVKRQECARKLMKNFAHNLRIDAHEYQYSFFLCAEKNFHQSPTVLRVAHLKALAPIIMLCVIICYVLTPAPLWCRR
jgi:hypothetical protein